MQVFGTGEAVHFCSGYKSVPAVAGRRPADIGWSKGTRIEGSNDFDAVRAALLEDAERGLFFAATHYRRALDLMMAASAGWAQVTLYYGSWYAAHAILGMFGSAVLRGKTVVQVATNAPGSQALRIGNETSTYGGSHQRFWDLFYRAVAPLRVRVAPALAFALTPVSSDPAWQIDRRNTLNYDTGRLLSLAGKFNSSFDKDSFPTCLPGTLGTQFRVTEGLVEVGFSLASTVGLRTAALGGAWVTCSGLRDCVREAIFSAKAPALVRKSRKSALV
jgi:hypothetical protein